MDANEWVNLIENIANTATGVASNVMDVINGSTSGSVSYVQPPQQTQSFQIPRAAWYVGAAIGGLLLIKALK